MQADRAGFYFVGAGIVPGFIAFAGDPGLALITLVFLMCMGGLGALADPHAPFRAAEARRPSRHDAS